MLIMKPFTNQADKRLMLLASELLLEHTVADKTKLRVIGGRKATGPSGTAGLPKHQSDVYMA